MKELIEQAKKDLIGFFREYIEFGITDVLKKKAVQVESKYLQASTLLTDEINKAIGWIVHFYAPTGIKPPTKEEAKEMIKKLQGLEDK